MSRWAWLVLAVGCGAPSWPAPPAPEVALQAAALTLGPPDARTTLSLNAAWLSEDGRGHGHGATSRVDGSPPITITADNSHWDLGNALLVFEQQVVVVRDAMTLRCAALRVRYQDGRVSEATASGGVQVSDGARRARSERARLDGRTGRLVLSGDPVLTEQNSTLSGNKIVFLLDTKIVECEKCTLSMEGMLMDRADH